jgi:hypothetical protein
MATVFLPRALRCNLYARHARRATRRSTIPRRTSLNSPISAKRERGSSVGKFFCVTRPSTPVPRKGPDEEGARNHARREGC